MGMMQKASGKQTGFTLIELMVVVSIIAILAAVGIPSYNDYMLRTNRATGKAKVMDVASRQEQYFLSNKSYTTTMTDLGFAGEFMDTQGQMTAAATTDTLYQITLAEVAGQTIATTYLITATPQGRQVNDAKCNVLTMDNTGNKTVSGSLTVSDCWGK